MQPIFVGLVGDHDPDVVAHRAVPKALGLAALSLGRTVDAFWIGTEEVEHDAAESLAGVNAVWVVPASPYRSMEGALRAVRHAREGGLPFLGTCGGFQHALIEIARDVCGLAGADHAETAPGADTLVVSPLACSLVGARGRIRLAEGSLAHQVYGADEIDEEYHCSFGVNPRYRQALEAGGVRFTGFDAEGDPRVMELPGHPFFVGTLFQPERAALRNVTPPLARAFLRAAAARADTTPDQPEAIAAAFGTI